MHPFSRFKPPLSLYVHVPVCASRCAYCDFHSHPRSCYTDEAIEALVDATLLRLDKFAAGFGGFDGGFETVYIGGGTPTALPQAAFRRLLEGLRLRVGRPREWTMEANPESLDEERLEAALKAGVTRLSLGVQSLDDGLLERLGRGARAADCERALRLSAGYPGLEVSADLIAGLPRRRPLGEEASALLELGVGHLSIYDLSIEEGTPLKRMVASGAFALPDEDEAAAERKDAELLLAGRGMRRYEVSNYAFPGRECRHNLCYWHMDSYIGVGPGAVSTLQAREAAGSPPGTAYSLRIEEGRGKEGQGSRATESGVGLSDAAFEMIMMGFRTVYGLDEGAFMERFGLPARSLIGKSLEKWKDRTVPAEAWPLAGCVRGENLALDSSGLDILNPFLVDCLGELEANLPPSARYVHS